MPEPDALRSHLAQRYGFRAHTLYTLEQDVTLLRRDDGPSWVARVFGPQRSQAAVEGDAAILRWLAEQHYPAERLAVEEPVSRMGEFTVLVTEAVRSVPRAQRRTAIKDAGGVGGFGELLGRLHALPAASGPAARPGGSWHHLSDGSPADELAAAARRLAAARAGAPSRDQAHLAQLADALAAADPCQGLPEAMTHPDFVLTNVVATPEPAMVLVDWTGAGRAARLWSLAVLLWAEGSKDLRRVELALSGYRRRVALEREELERLEAAIVARPLVLDIWRLHQLGLGAADAARNAAQTRDLAAMIAGRVRAVIGA